MPTLRQGEFWEAASAAFATDALELTVLPTEQCNLRCTYCYETFQVGRMPPEVTAAVRRLIENRAPGLRRLSVDWFGGEPLLAMNVIEEIGGTAQRLSQEHPSLDYESSITTNGVLLTDEYARRLAAVGVRHLHVSIDGPGEVHDRTRRLRGGRGTFEQIWRNLQAIRDGDVETRVALRVHVTPANVGTLDAFTDVLAETFLADERFAAYFFPIVDLGGPNQGRFPILTPRDAGVVVRRLTRRVAEAQANRLAKTKGCESSYVCYAAKPNAWVIRADGRLARCTVGLEDPANDIGRLRPDGSLEVHAERVRPWLRGWSTGDELSLHCPYEEMRSDVRSGLVVSRR